MDAQVACKGCGATLLYKPGTRHLSCDYCDHVTEFATPESRREAQRELNLGQYIDNFDTQSEHVERHVVRCAGCGAETEFPPNQQSGTCPFCDTSLIVEKALHKQIIKPKGVLPFAIEKKVAAQNFRAWLKKLWFAPNDLKKQITQHDKFTGLYLPFWTYDSRTISRYTGQRGDHYYQTVTRPDGKGGTKTVKVQHTRWRSAAGQVACDFDDVLIPASNSLPDAQLRALEPWDLPQLVDYKDDYLRGYVAETYQIDIKQGFQRAQEVMNGRIHQLIRHDIGGDVQRIFSVNTAYLDATFKHVLLPVWVSAYRYKGQLYQIIVNARTGEVQGRRPWSWVKLALLALVFAVVVGIIVVVINLKGTAQ